MFCRDSGQVTVLDSKQMILYTWDDPRGVRKLLWKPYRGIDKPIEAPVDKVTNFIIYQIRAMLMYGQKIIVIRHPYITDILCSHTPLVAMPG